MKLIWQSVEHIVGSWLARMSVGQRSWAVDRIGGLIWNALEAESRTQIFRVLGARLGVASYAVPGRLGTFEGGIHDAVVMDWYLRRGNWETWLQRLLREKIFRGGSGTYLDIGGNIGMTCIPLVRESAVRCYAFEPEPLNFGWLKLNVARNDVVGQVTCFQTALYSSDSGELEFEVSDTNMGDHRVRRADRAAPGEGTRVIRVPCARLDTVMDGVIMSQPLGVKLDTQGAELRVIRGGMQVLRQAQTLVAEVNPALLRAMGDTDEQLLTAFGELGFDHGVAFLQDQTGALPPMRPFAELLGARQGPCRAVR